MNDGGRLPTDDRPEAASKKPVIDSPARRVHVCSFCGRGFPSLQALGGHQTAHRKEIEEMRQEHKAIVESQRLDHQGPSLVTLDLLDRWEKRGSRQCEGKELVGDERNSEETKLDLTLRL